MFLYATSLIQWILSQHCWYWCFCINTSIVTVLSVHPCIISWLWVNPFLSDEFLVVFLYFYIGNHLSLCHWCQTIISLGLGRYWSNLKNVISDSILWIDPKPFLCNYPYVNFTEHHWIVASMFWSLKIYFWSLIAKLNPKCPVCVIVSVQCQSICIPTEDQSQVL